MSKIVVIGGGAAGTGAATQAKQFNEDHEVTLITEFEDIAYSPCGIPYVIGGEIDTFDKLFLNPPEFYEDEMGLNLKLETTVTNIDADKKVVVANGEEIPYDKLVISTGWNWKVPDLPGADLDGIQFIKNIRHAMELEPHLDDYNSVAVSKALPLGCELATAFAHRGYDNVTLIDEESWILSEFADPDIVEPAEEHMEEIGIDLKLGTELTGFKGEDGHLTGVETDRGDVPAELAFLATKYEPSVDLATDIGCKTGSTGCLVVDKKMQTNVDDVYAAGSCIEVVHGILDTPVQLVPGPFAYTQGKIAGVNAAGGNREYHKVYVPWGMPIGDVQVGGVLISETIANATDTPYITAEAEGITAARYHPNHRKLRVKLLADPDSHRLIGAQMVGGDGVKERADFLAFAIRKKATLEELATMENVYSPPIGALGEPIAIAAETGLNNL
ncbi:MAG: FAD-dependent oxidoreductase [bacterium]